MVAFVFVNEELTSKVIKREPQRTLRFVVFK